MSSIDPIIAEIRQEAATTRRMLERVPQGEFAWKPHEKSMALGRLAGHVAELFTFAVPLAAQDELDFAAGGYSPFNPATASELLARFDGNVAEAVEALGALADETLLSRWRLRRGEQVIFELPRAAAIRSFMLNHIYHHRGQLSVYLRLLDVPLPSVYGPTADETA